MRIDPARRFVKVALEGPTNQALFGNRSLFEQNVSQALGRAVLSASALRKQRGLELVGRNEFVIEQILAQARDRQKLSGAP